MAQFDGGKYKNGILSYNYLGEKGGKGKGGVSIKKIRGDWHFVDSKGEVRTDVGIKGKLTPTHIQNLEKDNIFAAANIDSTGKKLPKIKTGPDAGSSGGGTAIGSGPGPVDTGGGVDLEKRGNLRVAPQSEDFDSEVSIDYKKYTGDDMDPALVSKSSYKGGRIGPEGVDYKISPKVSLPDQTVTSSRFSDVVPQEPIQSSQSSSYGGSEFEAKHGPGSAPQILPSQTPSYGSTFVPYQGAGQMSLDNQNNGNVIAPSQELAGQNEFTGFGQDRMSGFGGVSPSFERSFSSDPALNTGTLEIGEGGKGSMWDSSFYRTKDGTLMKDTPWYKGGEDTVATQADIDAGITDQNASPWGSAEGWQAAGSVMKGVGGLASAYTGIKNYQLARDAHATQQRQWQANYNQRLKAYEDNKKLANQNIASRNRTLRARNANRTDLYTELA